MSVGVSAYKIDADPDQIRYEIMKFGPVEAEFIVYQDFLSYKSGMWQRRIFICNICNNQLYYLHNISSVKQTIIHIFA